MDLLTANHHKINYVEFPSQNLVATKRFFSTAFDWHFVDYGQDYIAFSEQGLDGGFFRSDLVTRTEQGAPLIVLFSSDLEKSLEQVEAAGAEIVKPIFTFPGGRRFQFIEPGGNELAVWSK